MNYHKQTENENCMCANPYPCKLEPIVMPVKEYVCNRYFYVEQPIIVPINKKIVNHYCPRPVYYSTYTTSTADVCSNRFDKQMM